MSRCGNSGRGACMTASQELISTMCGGPTGGCAALNCTSCNSACGGGGGGGGGSGGGAGSARKSSAAFDAAAGVASTGRNSCCPPFPSIDQLTGSGPCDDDAGGYEEGSKRIVDTANRLWKEQKLCDVIIQSDATQIKAHKLVLAAYSDFLLDKFCKFPAGEVISIDMTEFPIDIIMAVLTYCYTTRIEICDSTVGPLLKCADELGVCDIVLMCKDFMSNVTVETAIMFFSIAENYELCDMRDCIYQFIVNNFSEVSATKHFMYLPAERLYRILSEDCLNVTSEMEVFCALLQWIDFDRSERMCVAAKLLQCCVRLQNIPPEQLITKIEPIDWLFENEDCEFLINEAIRFHALKLSGSRLACSYPQQKARGKHNPCRSGPCN